MTKQMYEHLLTTTKSAEKLNGIICVAMYDTEIDCKDFGELLNEKNAIIMEERRKKNGKENIR